VLRVLERVLLVFGVVCLAYYSDATLESWLYQRAENHALDALLTRPSAEKPAPAATSPRPAGAMIGRLEIPRLGVSAVIRAGTDARTLNLAIGHVPGTALPGQIGNAGLAAHRDTFFRRLDDIRPDDELRVVTPAGTFTYRVERTAVVRPRDVWVLDPTPDAVLTLITCYPFTYVGPAPERFVVRAIATDGAGDSRPADPLRGARMIDDRRGLTSPRLDLPPASKRPTGQDLHA
jgi:sortase A